MEPGAADQDREAAPLVKPPVAPFVKPPKVKESPTPPAPVANRVTEAQLTPGNPKVKLIKRSEVEKEEEPGVKVEKVGFQKMRAEVVRNNGESRKAYRARLMEKLKEVKEAQNA